MSKMSQLHAELSEQAYSLGYANLESAIADGYTVDYDKCALVNGQEQAHKEWLKERDEVIADLELLRDLERTIEILTQEEIGYQPVQKLNRAIEFIKKGEF